MSTKEKSILPETGSRSGKEIKFHGTQVANVQVLLRRDTETSGKGLSAFDAAKDTLNCETINIQVISDFVTVTFYRNEKENIAIQRELIPTHRVERIIVKDLEV